MSQAPTPNHDCKQFAQYHIALALATGVRKSYRDRLLADGGMPTKYLRVFSESRSGGNRRVKFWGVCGNTVRMSTIWDTIDQFSAPLKAMGYHISFKVTPFRPQQLWGAGLVNVSFYLTKLK